MLSLALGERTFGGCPGCVSRGVAWSCCPQRQAKGRGGPPDPASELSEPAHPGLLPGGDSGDTAVLTNVPGAPTSKPGSFYTELLQLGNSHLSGEHAREV